MSELDLKNQIYSFRVQSTVYSSQESDLQKYKEFIFKILSHLCLGILALKSLIEKITKFKNLLSNSLRHLESNRGTYGYVYQHWKICIICRKSNRFGQDHLDSYNTSTVYIFSYNYKGLDLFLGPHQKIYTYIYSSEYLCIVKRRRKGRSRVGVDVVCGDVCCKIEVYG